MGGARPERLLPINADAIPAELRETPRWVMWRWEKRDGKWTKPPFQLNGAPASVTDPVTWTKFEAALDALKNGGSFHGIGFVLTDDDDIFGGDLDNSIDLKTAELTAEAQQIVAELRTYAEISPSGTGLRVIGHGKLPPGGRKKGNVEFYDAKRYVTLTGNRLPDTPTTIESCSELAAVHARVFGNSKSRDTAPTSSNRTDADERLQRALADKEARELFEKKDTLNPSVGDFDLCCRLARRGTDEEIDWWFRQSKRMRPKWDARHGEQTYGARTISKARAKVGEPNLRLPITVAPPLAVVVDRAVKILQERDRGLFLRSGSLVRIRRDAEPRPWQSRNAPIIESVTAPHVRDRLSRVADFLNAKGHPTMPPPWVGDTLLARDELRFRPLESVVECPTMRPDGSILQIPGYDAATGVIYEPNATFPTVPDDPTDDHLREALDLLDDLFFDFPFVAPSDRAAAHAALLSVVARPAILGCVPAFAVRAPTPGTGKSLLCDVISLVATGREAARMGRPASDEEMRKSILAIALDGSPIVLLDNETGNLASKELARAITAQDVEDRLLGVSKKVRAPMRAVWFFTGNNLAFGTDLSRRIVPIDLDAQLENPEDRCGFKHDPLLAYVKDARPQLVAGVLTILRAYCVAGRPDHRKSKMGSFERWDALVRGACIWTGLPDPEEGRARIRGDDIETEAIGAAFAAIVQQFTTNSFTALHLHRHYEQGNDEFKAAIAGWGAGKTGIVSSRSIGVALRKTKGRIVEGRRLFKERGSTGGKGWWRIGGKGDMGDIGDIGSASQKTQGELL